MSACVSSSLYSVSALTLLTAGALSSVREIGCMKVFGAPSTRLQLLSPKPVIEAPVLHPRYSQTRPFGATNSSTLSPKPQTLNPKPCVGGEGSVFLRIWVGLFCRRTLDGCVFSCFPFCPRRASFGWLGFGWFCFVGLLGLGSGFGCTSEAQPSHRLLPVGNFGY